MHSSRHAILARSAAVAVVAAVTATSFAQEPDANTRTQTAIEHVQAGRFEEARAILEPLIEEHPGVAGLHYYLGYSLTELGNNKDAIRHLERAAELDTTISGLYLALGTAYNAAGDRKKALQSFISERDAATDPSLRMASLINIGIVSRDEGDLEQSAVAFEEVASLDPSQEIAHGNLGTLYMELGQPAKALKALDRARNPDPNALYNIGVHFWQTKNYSDAAKVFRRVTETKDDYSEAYKMLGYALINLGEYPEAQTALKRFLELQPNSEDRAKVEDYLSRIGQQG